MKESKYTGFSMRRALHVPHAGFVARVKLKITR